MASTETTGRPIAVANLRKYGKILSFIQFIKSLILNITNNAVIFVTPAPTVAVVTTDNDDLEAKNTLAQQRIPGAVAARNVAKKQVKDDLRAWVLYVQGLADAAPDVETAILIIESSGLAVKQRGARHKLPLEVKNGEESGELLLIARATKDASYEWAMSTDGMIWVTFTFTLKGHAVINKRTPGEKLFFRVRAITRKGPELWTSAVSIIVQ